jgi:hypothetical protein
LIFKQGAISITGILAIATTAIRLVPAPLKVPSSRLPHNARRFLAHAGTYTVPAWSLKLEQPSYQDNGIVLLHNGASFKNVPDNLFVHPFIKEYLLYLTIYVIIIL